jgi:hypothetical protein
MKIVLLLFSCFVSSLVSGQCYQRYYQFDKGISPDWDLQTTGSRQNTINGVWAMHSKGNAGEGWSRMRYAKYTFNNSPTATTRIKVEVRGAPDGGKNSNAYLIQTKFKYDLSAAVQDGKKDEIDFFEYYGGSNKDTVNVFRKGQQVSGWPQTLTKATKAGNENYTYELILKKQEKYMLIMVYDKTGKEIERRELKGDSVPSEPMELFIGIWDCSGNSWCPGKVPYDTWMGVKSVFIEAC